MCQDGGLENREQRMRLSKIVRVIGVDLAKNSFQLSGAGGDGGVVFR